MSIIIGIYFILISFSFLICTITSADAQKSFSKWIVYNESPVNSNFLYDASQSHRILKTKIQDSASVELALAKSASGPIGSKPLIQRCKDGGEAYSAAYLISIEHLMYQKTNYNLTWVNCEMGSFIMMNGRANPQKNVNGSLLMSIDVLDFSVIHLSAYERLLLRWTKSSEVVKKDRNNLQPVIDSAEILRQRAVLLHSHDAPPEHPALHRTVIVMPFLGSDMGAGHSKLANRQAYLAACFWSFYAYYPYVVAMVKSPKDRDYVRKVSGLPFWDVILLEGLPKSASLPVATVQTTKAMIMNGTWGQFDYVFFTESDQILMLRITEDLYAYIDAYPRHLLLPHRLMAYPSSVLTGFHQRSISHVKGPYDWFDMQCCLKRQHCTDRNDWQKVSNESVPVLQVFGLQVPLGNSNFHAETYRFCTLRNSAHMQTCP